jgi:cyclic pyranopterin phosphate synthase
VNGDPYGSRQQIPVGPLCNLPGATMGQMILQPRALQSIRKLRLSVTDRCNLRCRYCMAADRPPTLDRSELLSLEEMAHIARVLCRHLPIQSIKLTGGEPLVRHGLSDLVAELAAIPGSPEISMTTNGTLLRRFAADLKRNGLTRVNVSLDSLDAMRFADVTRGGNLAATLDGINAALENELRPVKLNAVLRRSSWQQDVPQLLLFAGALGLEIRFIELMRTGTERVWCDSEFVSAAEIQTWLTRQGARISLETHSTGSACLSSVHGEGISVRVGWITPRSHPFCASCDRIRMNARGHIFRCLMDGERIPIAELIRTTDETSALIATDQYLSSKKSPAAMVRADSMASIGG